MELFARNVAEAAVAVLLLLHVTDTVQAGVKGHKRAVTCDKRYSEIDPGHSACLEPSSAATEAGVSEADKKVIVDAHNKERRNVDPPASNMMALSWDDSIANIAQRFAEACLGSGIHDTNYKRYDYGRTSVGQNLASGSSDWTAAVELWASEKADYDYDTNSSPNGKTVGHYTQVVWSESIRVGCGFARCDGKPNYVCNYGPSGNMPGKQPYTKGSSCASCSTSCNNKLCDCKEKFCKNGGTINPDTCLCSCYPKFFKNADCTLTANCESISDHYVCPSWKEKGYCESMRNGPLYCPNTCKWCPVAADA